MSKIFRVLTICMLFVTASVQAESFFDFSASTPEGSWAVREATITDHKGRQSITVTKQKHLGSEQRDGQNYFWLETEIDSYTVKKGKRKKDDDHAVLKVLVSEEAMTTDSVNAINYLQGFGKEIIMQSGDSNPIRISEGGMLAGAMMKSMGIEINHQFNVEGSETVETAVGKFDTKRIAGSGITITKVMFKKIEMQSKSLIWISEEVPFGIVKSEDESIINGDERNASTVLLEYGTSGAETSITGEPTELPF